MKPAPFSYAKPETLDGVFDLLDQHGDDAAILAGGQSLVAALNMRLNAPEIVIDINGLAEFSNITLAKDKITIGALTRHAEIEQSAEIARHAPLLGLAAPHIAHPAIRNRGTIGGSIALGDPAAEWPACLMALDARINLAGRNGMRQASARGFFNGLYDTDIAEGELVASIEVAINASETKSAFEELSRRHGDFAMAGIAAHAKCDNARLVDIALVFFGVADRPVLAIEAARVLTSGEISGELTAQAQTALQSDLDPIDDMHCSAAVKLHLAKQLLAKAVKALGDNGG